MDLTLAIPPDSAGPAGRLRAVFFAGPGQVLTSGYLGTSTGERTRAVDTGEFRGKNDQVWRCLA